jgi:hypothetical protein
MWPIASKCFEQAQTNRLRLMFLNFDAGAKNWCLQDGQDKTVTPQLSAGKHRPNTNLNCTVAHNFQYNAKKYNIQKKKPYRA